MMKKDRRKSQELDNQTNLSAPRSFGTPSADQGLPNRESLPQQSLAQYTILPRQPVNTPVEMNGQTTEPLPITFETFKGRTFVEDVKRRIQAAWSVFEFLDRQPLTPQELQRFGQVPGVGDPVYTSLLAQFAALPNTQLQLVATMGPNAPAGATGLTAKTPAGPWGERESIRDTGWGTAMQECWEYLLRIPPEKRGEVKFTIRILIGMSLHAATGVQQAQSIGYYLETFIHELALHAEKYLPLIRDYQRGTLQGPVEYFEGWEHKDFVVTGVPRFIGLSERIQAEWAADLADQYSKAVGEDAELHITGSGAVLLKPGDQIHPWIEEYRPARPY